MGPIMKWVTHCGHTEGLSTAKPSIDRDDVVTGDVETDDKETRGPGSLVNTGKLS